MPVSPKINSPAEDEHCGLNPSGKRPRYFQRNKSKQNADRNAQRKKKPESISLTLLEILCSDVENGVLLTKTGNHSYSGCEASEKCFKDSVSRIRSQSNQEKRLNVVGQPEVRNRSTSASSAAVHNFENSLKSPSSADLSSQVTNTSELERSAQNLSLSSVHSKIDFWPGETPKSSQSTKINIRKDVARNLESSRNSSTTKNERSMDSDRSGSCRFVHFSDGRKLKKKKGKKKDPGTKQANDKLNRTESSDVKFFQIDVPQGSNRGKSQVSKMGYDKIKIAPEIKNSK